MKFEDKKAYEVYLAKLERLSKTSFGVNPNQTADEKKAEIQKAKDSYAYCTQKYFPHYCTSATPKFHIKLANKVRKNPKYKGLVRWGRGLAKSVVCDITIVFWLWINDDVKYVVLVGENQEKADILLGDLQSEFEANAAIINDFGEQKVFGFWEKGYFKCQNGFIAKALGAMQSARGLRVGNQRPDMVIFDDLDNKNIVKNPVRCDEMAQWILRDVIPVMDDGNRRVLVPNNRFAPKTIQSTLEDLMPNWDVDRVDAFDSATYAPAWPEKYTAEHYRYIVEEEIGKLAAEAEYNNNPHVEGKLFKAEMIQWVQIPRLNQFETIVGHWDVAYAGTKTSDYNAVKIWGIKDNCFYCIKSFCKQTEMDVPIQWMFYIDSIMPKTVQVNWQFESQFWNGALQMTLGKIEAEHNRTLNLTKVDRPNKNKYDRIITLLPHYQQSRIYHNINEKGNNDMQVSLSQLYGIEPGYKTHDDGPDADEAAIKKLTGWVKMPKPENASESIMLGDNLPTKNVY